MSEDFESRTSSRRRALIIALVVLMIVPLALGLVNVFTGITASN